MPERPTVLAPSHFQDFVYDAPRCIEQNGSGVRFGNIFFSSSSDCQLIGDFQGRDKSSRRALVCPDRSCVDTVACHGEDGMKGCG